MQDIHSHIVFAVDDGSESMQESIAMLHAAKKAGIDTLYATPHWKSRYGDVERIKDHFQKLVPAAAKIGIEMHLGFEFNISALDPRHFEQAAQFAYENTSSILLEMPFEQWPAEWGRIIFELQKTGLQIVIAHPERYAPVQKDLGILRELTEIGCLLQCNAASFFSLRPAKKRVIKYIQKLDRLDFVASDAHSAREYELFARAVARIGKEIRNPEF